ncbi:MAG TPA: hypothetical protein VLB84_13325 [Bacteroidia bacterium]|jgi:hypothetical protein|nr:hypothetical protein [Bacteroidia bacterium]
MFKHFLILIALFVGNYVNAGSVKATSPDRPSSKLVYGKVIDKITGEEIAGAEIQIGEKKVYSDLDGNFSAVVATDAFTSKVEAAVNYISYNEACITIDLYSFTPLVIEIVSK